MADYIPPEIALEQRKLDRRRKMAELLAQQDPMQGQMVSGHYVGASPVQGIANLAKAYLGAKANRKLDTEEADLEARNQQILADEVSRYQTERKGVSPGENGVPLMMKPVSQRDAITKYLAAQNPAIRDMAQYDIGRMDTASDTAASNEFQLDLQGREDEADLAEKEMLARQRSDDSEANRQNQFAIAELAAANRPQPTALRPVMDTIVDPKDPTRSIRVDMNTYDESKYLQGDASGVKGESPKEGDSEKNRVKKLQAMPVAKTRVSMITDMSERLKNKATELKDHPGLDNITGWLFGRTPTVSQEGRNAQAILETIKSQIFIETLQAMREASKTGGAVGNVSDREGDRLENAMTALEQSQDTDTYKKRLQELIDQMELSKQRVQTAYDDEYGNLGDSPIQPADDGWSDL